MNEPFTDPEFLQSVGEMTISFALLDAMLSHAFNAMEGNCNMAKIAGLPYSQKVDKFIEVVQVRFAKLGSSDLTDRNLERLKNDLSGVAARRNSLNHDFWTMSEGRKTLKSLKGKGVPDPYPTPE